MKTNISNYEEASFQKILRPQIAKKGKSFDKWITSKSDMWQRIAVVQLTRYLCLELGYKQDLTELASEWERNKTKVFAILDDLYDKEGFESQVLIGIVTFHQFNQNPLLYHCYLHPFYRRKGYMQKAWNEIRLMFKNFEIEYPISAAMQTFMTKVDCSHIIPTT